MGHQWSAYWAACPMPTRPALPRAIGTGACTGFGYTHDGLKRSKRPSRDGASSVQIYRSASTRSRMAE